MLDIFDAAGWPVHGGSLLGDASIDTGAAYPITASSSLPNLRRDAFVRPQHGRNGPRMPVVSAADPHPCGRRTFGWRIASEK